ncbi:glycoside hydrolase family 6 protein [Streptomyces sp. NBC_00370]
MVSGPRGGRRAERLEQRRAGRRRAALVAASAVVAAGALVGTLVATGGPGPGRADTASSASRVAPAPSLPPLSPSPVATEPSPSPSPTASPSKKPVKRPAPKARPATALYRHPDTQVREWVGAHRDDPRRPVIESRIAARPEAVWFDAYDPGSITGEVRSVTSRAAAAGRTAVLVPYVIPQRDCGGASDGGAPDLAAYDGWIRNFARGLGSREVIVILEPDAIAENECLDAAQRAARYASLARAGRTLHAADPAAKVYFDGGHSGWNSATKQAGLLRAADAAGSSDGIFTNVSNFHRTTDEARYARAVLAALGGPARLGAVIDTSRNGNGAPPGDQWCDPAGRALGQAPTTRTGEARIDAYLWVKSPGESDGCKGAAGSFTADYAYELATG